MKSMRLVCLALCAVMMSSAFAQNADELLAKQKVAEAAAKYKAGKTSEAITDLETLNKEYPTNPSVATWLGFLYLQTGEAKKAVPFLERANTANPKDLEVLNNLGNAYVSTGQKQKALAKFQELATLNPNMFEPYYNMGNIYLGDKDYAKAVGAYKKASELRSNDPYVLNNLGVAYEGSSKFSEAAAAFQKSSDLENKNGAFARNAGAVNYRLQRYATAKTYLSRALNNGVKDKDLVLALGDCYNRSGETDNLNALYAKNSEMLGGEYSYHYNMGVLKKKNNDTDGAIEAFRKAYQLKDNDPETLNNLGVLLFNKGEYEESRVMFEKLVGLQSTARNKRNFAAAAARAGDVKAAVPVWRELLGANPNDVEIRLLLADSYYDQGNVKDAMFHYKTAQKAKSNSVVALDGIGRCHLYDNNYPAAEAALRSAIEADPKYVPSYNNLAVVLEKMNRRKQAVALLEKAAQMDPDNADVQRNLKRMRAAG